MSLNEERYKKLNDTVLIELHLKQAGQLFDLRDPAPFREKDIDEDAAAYILHAVEEFKLDTPMQLVIYLSESTESNIQNEDIMDAIHNHFSYETELVWRKLKRLLKEGQISFLIALIFLGLCMFIAHYIIARNPSLLAKIISEGFIIIGWVAMWRPIDLFLYGWWPKLNYQKLLNKISKIPVEIVKI